MSTVMILVSLIVGIIIFVVSEFLIPVHPTAKNRSQQKHFWATVLALVALLITLSLTFLTNTEQRLGSLEASVGNVSRTVGAMATPEPNSYMWDIFASESEFERHQDDFGVISSLKNAVLSDLSEDMKAGYLPVRADLFGDLAKQLLWVASEKSMNPSVVATNVGNTRTYFDEEYIAAHQEAAELGVPILRFFIYDEDRKIAMRGSPIARKVTKQEFLEEAKAIHEETHSVYSCVIDSRKHAVRVGDSPRDFVIVNNDILLEGMLNADWETVRIRASAKTNPNICCAQKYLAGLKECDTADKFMMDDTEIRESFGRFIEQYQLDGQGSLAPLFLDILVQSPGPDCDC